MNLFNNSFDGIATQSQRKERFLVLVHLIEGSDYLRPNMNTSGQVQIYNETKSTRTRKASHAPYYNETFVFDFDQTFDHFLDNVVTLTVMDTGGTFKKPLGVCQFDLSTVWDMPGHLISHKWAKLIDPHNRMPFIKGYLKFDLYILAPGETLQLPTQPKESDESIERNLLFEAAGRNLEAQAKYVVKVYKGKDFISKSDIPLLNNGNTPSRQNYTDVSMTIKYAKNTLESAIKPYSISYMNSYVVFNDQFTFTELFPPTFRRIKVEVLLNKTVIYTFHISLRDIDAALGLSKEALPIFGPTVVYIYTNDTFYTGRLIMSLEVIPVSVSLLKLNVGTAEKSRTVDLHEEKLWQEEEFLLFMSVYEMGMLRKDLSGNNMSLVLSMAHDEGVLNKTKTSTENDGYYYFDLTNDKPCIHLKVKLPDLRKRLFLTNRIDQIRRAFKEKLAKVEKKIFSKDVEKAKKTLEKAVIDFVESLGKFDTSCKHLKQDDRYMMKQIRRSFADIQKDLEVQLNEVNSLEDKIIHLRTYTKTLSKLTERYRMSFPYIFIYVLNKTKLVSTCKIFPGDIIYSDVSEERGLHCGKFNTLFFTDFKKKKGDTLGGRIETYMWFGLASEQEKCIQMLPIEEAMIQSMLSNKELPTVIEHTSGNEFQCRAHLFSAVIDLGHDITGLADVYVKVITGSKAAISHTVRTSVTPIWKETVIIPRTVRYRTKSRIQENQPTIVLELWDSDSFKTKSGEKILQEVKERLKTDKDDLVGRVIVKPNVILRDGNNGVTKLRTYPIYNGTVQVGEITAAIELVEVLEKNELNEVEDDRIDKAGAIVYKMPQSLMPPMKTYIMEVLFWGLRDVKKIRSPCISIKCGDAKLNSSIIRNYNRDQNFVSLTGLVQVNLSKYKIPLVIKLYRKKRNNYIYKGICVQANINDLFRNFIEAKEWKETLNERKHLLHEKATEDKSRQVSEVKISMDIQMMELERFTRKNRRARKTCIVKCQKCLQRSGKNALKVRQYLHTLFELSTWKQNFGIFTIPYLFISLVQVVLWTLEKIILVAMYCICGYNRTAKIRSNYHQLIKLEENAPDANNNSSKVYDTFNVSGDEEEEDMEKDDWWTLYYNSVYNSDAVEKIKQIQSEKEERKTIRLCKCCEFVPKLFTNRLSPNKIEAAPEITNPPALVIYRNELEKVPEFEQLSDKLRSFNFYYGKLFSNNKNRLEDLKVGAFKGNVLFYPADNEHLVNTCGKPLSNGTLGGSMQNAMINVTIRVYIVRAHGIHPQDRDGKCDPYIILKTGTTEFNDRDNYVHNDINPYFGRYFEIQGSFPENHTLEVILLDRDAMSKDDFIGKTSIDLEARFYSKHRGSCGLARKYTPEWRDQLRPSQLLEELCDSHEIGYPAYFENSVVVASREFKLPANVDSEDFREELALFTLNNWHQVPLVGTHLVPQHIESRTLYSSQFQGVSQGVLEMWVDMFTTDYGWIPSAVNIALRQPVEYQLRVIVWNTADVELMDDAYFTGEKHSDIYVKGWLQGREDVQQTDIHYRSAQGEGFFNWRFLFEVKYFAAESLMLVTKKDEEYRVPPKLHLQVWDNDNFSPDDYIGTLVLDLSHMPRGARTAARCTGDIVSDAAPTLNLFRTRRCRGWWPFMLGGNGPDKYKVVGKLEAEVQILTKEEAERNPVGIGRKEPEALPIPVRPDRFDFNFLWTPYRVILGIVKAHKGKFILGGLVLLLVLFVMLFVYAFPGLVAKWMLPF